MIVPENWKWGALAATATSVAVLVAWLAVSRAGLKAELAEARAHYIMCENANAAWAAQAQKANEALKRLNVEAAVRQKKAERALQRAAREARQHEEKARTILESRGRGDPCRDANELIRGYVEGKR